MDQAKDKSLELAEYEKKATRSITDKNLLLQETLQYGTEEANIRAQVRQLERMYLADGKELLSVKKDQVMQDLRAQKQLERQLALYKEIGTAIRTGLVDVLQAAFDKTKSINQAMNKLINSVSDKLLDYGMSYLLANSGLPGAKKFFGFANGGRPPVGRPSVVGEKGPELFVPDSAGTVVPNHAMGGASVVVNVDASGSQVQGDEGQAAILGRAISTAVTEEIARQKRPGGLLSA